MEFAPRPGDAARMDEIKTELEIAATPRRVWEILADWPGYADWNPYITRIEATTRVVTRLNLRVAPPGGRVERHKPALVTFSPERELSWYGQLGLPGLADTERVFRLEPAAPGRVRMEHVCRLRGPLRPRSARRLARHEEGMRQMNEALRRRAEGRPAERLAA